MSPISLIIFLLFFPAGLGILKQIIWGAELSHQLLAVGMFVFSIEQARMAVKDLQQIADAKAVVKNEQLNIFTFITIVTILIELIGFYISSSWLGWGSIIILISQLWFNLLANIKIQIVPEVVIQNWEIKERLSVLIADVLGIILVSLWMMQIASLGISVGLFALVLVYLGAKLYYFRLQDLRF